MSHYNDLKISPEDFSELPRKSKDLIIYQNLININKKVEEVKDQNFKQCSQNNYTNKFQYIWLFLLTVAIGLKKYLPFF